jgi:hypothetical protein
LEQICRQAKPKPCEQGNEEKGKEFFSPGEMHGVFKILLNDFFGVF